MDIRTFHHDRAVLNARLEFEAQGNVSRWISERDLLSGRANDSGLHWRNIPDAVIEVTTGERIAFEVEMSLKARDRYVDKIRYYVERIREPHQDTSKISKVLYRCFKRSIFRSLQSETLIYGSYFQIESADMGCI